MIQKRYRLVDPSNGETHFTSGWHNDDESNAAAFVDSQAAEFRENNGSGFAMEVDVQEVKHISTERIVSVRHGKDL